MSNCFIRLQEFLIHSSLLHHQVHSKTLSPCILCTVCTVECWLGYIHVFFALWIVEIDPLFITCHNSIQKNLFSFVSKAKFRKCSFSFNSDRTHFSPFWIFPNLFKRWKWWIRPHLMLLLIILMFELNLHPSCISASWNFSVDSDALCPFTQKSSLLKCLNHHSHFFGLEHVHHKFQLTIDNSQQPFSSNGRRFIHFSVKRLFLVQILTLFKLWKIMFCAQWQLRTDFSSYMICSPKCHR